MSRGEKRVFLAVLAILIVAMTLMALQEITGANTPSIYQVSILMDGAGEDYWKNFRKGVNQAALESSVDVRFISRYDGAAATGQSAALRQEWAEGTDGVVLIPVDGEEMARTLGEAPNRLAVAVVGPKLATDHAVGYVSADNAKMGADLADAVYADGRKTCTVFLPLDAGTAAGERFEGFSARMKALGVPCERMEEVEPDRLWRSMDRALVALEPGMTEALRQIEQSDGRIYGVGASNRLLRYLEDGQVSALVVQSDYNAGYLSLMSVVGALKGVAQSNVTLSCYTVLKENMFEEPLVQLLFPIS